MSRLARGTAVLLAVSLALLAAQGFAAPAPSPQAAQNDGEEITIRAKGEGTDAADAKNDATRQALRQAVGAFVDVKTVVDGDQIVSERIMSATSALVIGSKVVSGPKRRGDGLYEVECEVRIRKRNLVASLTEVGFVLTGKIDGDAAIRVSTINFKNTKEAETLLQERVERLWSKLMIGRLLDDDGVPLGEGELPTVVRQNGGRVVVCANAQIYFHLEAYYTKFVPEMKLLLEALAVGKGEHMVNRATWRGSATEPQSRFGGVPAYGTGEEPERWTLSESQLRYTLWISDGRDEHGLNEHFSGFELTAEVIKPLAAAMQSFRAHGCRFLLELLDGEQNVIAARTVQLSREPAWMRSYKDSDSQTSKGVCPVERVSFASAEGLWHANKGSLVLSPSFKSGYGSSFPSDWNVRQHFIGGSQCDVFELRVELELPASDLSNVQSYRITAVE